jgi:hypothetical protein
MSQQQFLPPISTVLPDQNHLGALAMEFRGSQTDRERRAIADDYAATVDRLIRTGNWDEMPAMEDQLPDEWMPHSFHEFWA